MDLHVAAFAELDTTTLYALLKLRSDVFVVEQRSAYAELDGRDPEPGTRHIWAEQDMRLVGYLRVVMEQGAARIGRVCVAREARGSGVASRLMKAALDEIGPDMKVVLDAQTYLVPFYRSHGFVETGPEFDDEGVLHIPMERES